MIEEKIVMNCITSTSSMYFTVTIDKIETVMRNTLRVINNKLGCYIPQLIRILKEKQKLVNSSNLRYSEEIRSTDLFEVLDDPAFWKDLRKVIENQLANGFETILNIKMVKIALYLWTQKRIRYKLLSPEMLNLYFNSYIILDTESMRNGVKQDPDILFRSFTMASRYLPLKFIRLWLEHNKKLLADQTIILPDEYFILASNTYNKSDLIKEKIPSMQLSIAKDHKTGTFIIDQDLTGKPDFDTKLEKIMGNIPVSNIIFDFNYNSDAPKEKNAKKRKFSIMETGNFKKFQKSMSDPELLKRLKSTLTSTNVILNKTKVNSENFSYLGFRTNNDLVSGFGTVANTSRGPSDPLFSIKPMLVRPRPNTSRPVLSRPISSSYQKIIRRPQTGVPKLSNYSSALQLGVKNEPYHVLTLREAVTLNSSSQLNY
jgi:hypothetical protein